MEVHNSKSAKACRNRSVRENQVLLKPKQHMLMHRSWLKKHK
jgi:hypothetical protein